MHCIMCTLQDAKGDLRMVRDQEHDKTLECIWHQYEENGEDSQSTPNHGRGYVCHTDCYFAQRLLKKQPEWRLGECLADVRNHHSQSREQGHEGWHVQPGRDRPQGLYAHHETPERAPRGHPLGGGHPKRVLQEFHNAFHSAQEDPSDTASGSESGSEVEEWDDLVAYNTKTSKYTTVPDQEHRRVHNHRRMNKHWHCERHPGYGKTKQLSLSIFRDSTWDNTITYDNWRSDVDNYIREGHSTKLIRDSVLCALEGHPHYTAKTAMDDGDGSLCSIMEVLDLVYGRAATYSVLMSKLNTIQQGNGEAAKDYYECVVQLRVKLQEFTTTCSNWGTWSTTPRMPSSMACVQSTRPWWFTSETTPKPASHIYLLLYVNVRRMRLSTTGVDEQSMLRHTTHPQVSPLTEPTIQIHTSGGCITVIKIRHVIIGRTITTAPTSPYMLRRWNLPWKFKPKRIIFRLTSIMMMHHRTGMM